jgi:hypothetical protein
MATKLKIKKGDQGESHHRPRQGQDRRGLRVCRRKTAWSFRASTWSSAHQPSQKQPAQGGIIEKEARSTSPTSPTRSRRRTSRPGRLQGSWATAARSAFAKRLRRTHRPARGERGHGDRASARALHEVRAEALMKEFSYQNPMQVPKLDKIVINMGVGEAVKDRKKSRRGGRPDAIAGQKPVITKARKSIATSSCAKAWRSAARSRCAATGCTSSSTA